MFTGLIPLAILGAIVYAIVKNVQERREAPSVDAAPLAIKRLLLFGSLYAAVHVAAWGLAGLIGLLGDSSVGRGERAAEPLAMAVVAVPIAYFLGRWVWRGLSNPSERDAAFSLYVNAMTITAILIVLVAGIQVGDSLVAGGDFSSSTVGALAVWTPIWLGHWLLWRRFHDDVANVHVYLGSIAALGTCAAFGALLVDETLARLLDAGTASDVGVAPTDDVEFWFVGLAVSGVIYVTYWLLTGVREPRDVAWHAYVILAGVLGGLIAAVVGAGVSAYAVLVWLFGDPDSTSAVRHFEDFTPFLAAFVVGFAVWIYHRIVLGPVAGPRTEVNRVYDYVVTTVGLVTAIIGSVILLVALQESAFPPEANLASDANTLLGAATTLAVGAPLWLQAWMRVKRRLRGDQEAELRSPTRRSFLFGIVGIGGVVGAIALIVLLVVVFDAVLGEGGDRLREDVQIPAAILLAVGTAVAYHFHVLRSDQAVAPEPDGPRKRVVLVTADEVLATAVRDLTGARVTVLRRIDSDEENEDANSIAAAIAASDHEDLLVVPGPESAQVIPYRR